MRLSGNDFYFCLGTEVPRLSALGVGPTVRGTSEVQSAQEWKCKVHNSILQNGENAATNYKPTSQPPTELRKLTGVSVIV